MECKEKETRLRCNCILLSPYCGGTELPGKELKTSGEQQDQLAKLLNTEMSHQSRAEGVRMTRSLS